MVQRAVLCLMGFLTAAPLGVAGGWDYYVATGGSLVPPLGVFMFQIGAAAKGDPDPYVHLDVCFADGRRVHHQPPGGVVAFRPLEGTPFVEVEATAERLTWNGVHVAHSLMDSLEPVAALGAFLDPASDLSFRLVPVAWVGDGSSYAWGTVC